jgi:hypothetical protein
MGPDLNLLLMKYCQVLPSVCHVTRQRIIAGAVRLHTVVCMYYQAPTLLSAPTGFMSLSYLTRLRSSENYFLTPGFPVLLVVKLVVKREVEMGGGYGSEELLALALFGVWVFELELSNFGSNFGSRTWGRGNGYLGKRGNI